MKDNLLHIFIISALIISFILTSIVSHYIEMTLFISVIVFLILLVPSSSIARPFIIWHIERETLKEIGKTREEVEYIVKTYPQEEWHKH